MVGWALIFVLNILDVVTINACFCPSQRGGRYLCPFRTGADVSPLQGRTLLGYTQIFQGQKTALMECQGINKR